MPGVLIKLTPLALTRTQVQDYALPRIPIKEEDCRKSGFEERHGEGAVERDALEAPYPGMLAQVVREAIAPYRDLSLQQPLFDTERTARRQVQQAWQAETYPYREELARLERDV
jgi:hypothetical protein